MIKFGICNELFEDWGFRETCETIKKLGYDGVEIAPFTLAQRIVDLPSQRLSDLASVVSDAGLETIGLHWLLAKTEGFHLTSSDKAVRGRTGDYLIELGRVTKELGGNLMVLGSPKQRDVLNGVSYDAAMNYAVEVLTKVSTELGSMGLDLCFEPLAPSETNFVNTCAEANALIARVGLPNFKLHMDVKAQSSERTATVPELIRKHARTAGHFHAQDVNMKGPGMGEVDFVPILEALVDSGYDRWVSVEVFDFSPGPEATASKSIATLKSALAKATP